MATRINSAQILDESVKRSDLNSTTPGNAVIKKLLQGTGVILNSTGVESGTGDVTVNLAPPVNPSSGFRAHSTVATGTLAVNTYHKALFNNVEYNIDAASFSGSRFTAPTTGYYMVGASVGLGLTTAQEMYKRLVLYKGGVIYTVLAEDHGFLSTLSGFTMMYMGAGEYIEVYLTVDTAVATSGDAAENWFTATQMQVVLGQSQNATIRASEGDILPTDSTVTFSPGQNVVAALPPALENKGRTLRLKKLNSNSATITVTAASGELIDESPTYVLEFAGEFVELQSLGTGWAVVGE